MAKVDLSLKSIFTRISVLFIFLLNIECVLVNSALADIAKAFPKADPSMISLICTISNVLAIIVAFLLVPQLVKIFNKRQIVLAALVIYVVGGMGSAFVNSSIYYILACRALLGFGMGLTAPLCGAIINELYQGLDKKNMIGWANAVDSSVGIVLTMIAGYLCTIDWRYTFLAYGFFIIVVIMEFFFLPSMPVPMIKDASGVEHRAKAAYTPRQRTKLILVLGYAMVFMMSLFTIMLKTAIFVAETGLGDALTTATSMSVVTAGVLTASYLFGIVENITKKYCLTLCPLFAAIGAFTMYSSASVTQFFIGSYILGLGFGLFQPLLTVKALAIGPVYNGAFANSMMYSIMGVGVVFSTFVEKVVGIFIAPAAKNLVGVSCALFVIVTVVSLIYAASSPFKGVNEEVKTAIA